VQDGFSTPKKSCMRNSTNVTPTEDSSSNSNSNSNSSSVTVSATLYESSHDVITAVEVYQSSADVIPLASPPGMGIIRCLSEPSTHSLLLPNEIDDKDKDRKRDKDREKEKEKLGTAHSAAAAVLASFSTTKEWIREEVRTFNKLPPNSSKFNTPQEQMQAHDEEAEGDGNEDIRNSIDSKRSSPLTMGAATTATTTATATVSATTTATATSAGASGVVEGASVSEERPVLLRTRTDTVKQCDIERLVVPASEKLSPYPLPFPPPLRFSPHSSAPLPLPLTLTPPPSFLVASKVEKDTKTAVSISLTSQPSVFAPAPTPALTPSTAPDSTLPPTLVPASVSNSTSASVTALVSVAITTTTTTTTTTAVSVPTVTPITAPTPFSTLLPVSVSVPIATLVPAPVPAPISTPVPVLEAALILQPSETDILTMKACEEMNLMTTQMQRDKESVDKEESESKCLKWLGKLSGATELLQNKIAVIKSNMISSDATLFSSQSPPFFRKSVTESSLRSRSQSDAVTNTKLTVAMNGIHGILHRRHSYNARGTYYTTYLHPLLVVIKSVHLSWWIDIVMEVSCLFLVFVQTLTCFIFL
jgi:hypothetical protein